MAKRRATSYRETTVKSHSRKRPGIHSKTKSSKLKKSKHYKKRYKGQGR